MRDTKGERAFNVEETWECPKCGWIYQSPIEIEDCWHTVKEQGKKETHRLKKVKK